MEEADSCRFGTAIQMVAPRWSLRSDDTSSLRNIGNVSPFLIGHTIISIPRLKVFPSRIDVPLLLKLICDSLDKLPGLVESNPVTGQSFRRSATAG